MNKIILSTVFLMIMSIDILAESTNTDSNLTEAVNKPIEIKSVRGIMGGFDPFEHSKGQIRAGYITLSPDVGTQTSAYALGGHYHFDTKRWNGLQLGASVYTVLNMGINQNPDHLNGDFFDNEGKSFVLLTKAFLDGKWGNTEIKLGRQSLDTPHADSDDIRMIPNFFEAYTITNNDINNLTLSAGYINRIAGWANAVNACKFVNVAETIAANFDDERAKESQGIAYASANYEGIENLSLSFWYYNYQDIANVIYAEAGYEKTFENKNTLTLGLQYDASSETGTALLGEQDAETFGLSANFMFETVGVHVLAAYNRDNGNTGATGLSLGGGPFFTSMEDQTLDTIGQAGSAWLIGVGYHFEKIGISGLTAGIAYGNFQAKDSNEYASEELDAVIDYEFNEKFSLTAAYASVHFDHVVNDSDHILVDYDQFRVIANYSF